MNERFTATPMTRAIYRFLTVLFLVLEATLTAFSSFAFSYALYLDENTWIWLIVYVACLVGILALDWVCQMLYHRVYEDLIASFQDRVFDVQLGRRELLTEGNGEKLFSFATNDMSILRNQFFPSLYSLTKSLLNLIASLVAMSIFNVWFGLGFLIGALILFPVLWAVNRSLGGVYSRLNQVESEWYSKVDDYSAGYREFRHVSREDLLVEAFERREERFISESKRLKRKANALTFSGTILSELIICGLIGLSVYLGLIGEIDLPVILALLQLLLMATSYVDTSVQRFSEILKAKPIFRKMKELCISDREEIAIEDLDIEEVSFIGADGKRLFAPVSFSVKRGEKVLLEGSNGSGKTVLLTAMAGAAVLPRKGEILSEGEPLPESFIPQGLSYYCGRDIYLEGEASLGQKQFEVLREALDSADQLLILDEAFADLDSERREEALRMVEESDKAIIFVDHSRSGFHPSSTVRLEAEHE